MLNSENTDLRLAFDFVEFTNRNIFLTGKAGTGKTTFLHNLKKKSPKRMIVVAPTGVAAINAGGVTIHSFFQLPFHPHIPSQYITSGPVSQSPLESPSFKMSREKIRIIKGLDLLVIDEISMVRADLLDAVDLVLRRFRDRNAPFGGVQLLMIGDIQQLAPVAKEEEWGLLENYYSTPFFFGSLALRSTNYITIELRHIYRQQDQHFIELLNKVRDNQLDQQSLQTLNKRYNPDFRPNDRDGYITLTTHNSQAQGINESRLQELPSKPHLFKAAIQNEFPEYAYPTFSELILKTDAQVMFVKNDISRDKLFFNGKIGRVEGFEKDRILVRCPGDNQTIAVERAEWQNMKYILNDETKVIEEKLIGTFTQYPLKTAWAITIHKSQGLTFEKAIIDARSAFAHGQIYVALSRCRTLEGLVLNTPISKQGIINDPAVSGFIRESEQNRPNEKTLTESRVIFQKMLIQDLFDFSPMLRGLYYTNKLIREHAENLVGHPADKAEHMISFLKTELILVSEKFIHQVNNLLTSEPNADLNGPLQERITKASQYFSEKLNLFQSILSGLVIETDNKAVKKSIGEALERVKQDWIIKTVCLDKCKSGFRVAEYLEVKAKAAIDIVPEVKSKPPKTVEDTSGADEHPVLYNRIRKWRDSLAAKSDLPVYMILPVKTIATLTTLMPRTREEISRIKGMGKKKCEQYADEIIAIITDYCTQKHVTPVEYVPKNPPPKSSGEKKHTREITFELYKAGNSTQQIAAKREMALTTIENHLAEFVATGELPVSDFVSPDLTDLIISRFEDQENMLLGPVKVALGDQVTWSDIRFVASHLQFLKKKSN